MDQVCSYKYTVVQQQFGKEQDNAISITAAVEIQCNSCRLVTKFKNRHQSRIVFFAVGSYNGTAATEYCMEVNLDGSMFLDSEEKTYAKSATNYYNHVAKTVVFSVFGSPH